MLNKWDFLTALVVSIVILVWELSIAGTPDISEYRDVAPGGIMGLLAIAVIKYLVNKKNG